MDSRKNRIMELDVFRGLAAIAVMLYNYTTRYPEIFHNNSKYYPIYLRDKYANYLAKYQNNKLGPKKFYYNN